MKKLTFLLVLCSVFCISANAGAHKMSKHPRARVFQQLTGDPWIFNAYNDLYRRQPNALELNIHNYNNGTWGSYTELKQYVQDFQNSLRNQNITIAIGSTRNSGQLVAGLVINGQLVAASIVAAGGGNIVAAGGGNIVAAGGGNIVAAGGGNFKVSTSTAGLSFGSNMGVLALGARRIPTSGKGAFVIK
jgi:hypothetical protein